MEKNKSKLLGIAFVFQFVTSLTSGILQKGNLFVSENIKLTIIQISNNQSLMTTTILLDILTSCGVIFLGAALYTNLNKSNKIIAFTAFGLYILEASLHIISRVEAFTLLQISREYLILGESKQLLKVGAEVFGKMDFIGSLMMLAFCSGAILFYYLIVKTKIVPRALSMWGLITVSFLFIWTTMKIIGYEVPFILYLPYVPFELTIGIWILIKSTSNLKSTSKMKYERTDL